MGRGIPAPATVTCTKLIPGSLSRDTEGARARTEMSGAHRRPGIP